ncbi:hypothetical protein [Helicobacter pylori]|uniref:hypothetical protein n=1 Tax=Helicobacter pylori TaxID=210 RepID=UPI0013CE381A|nr:hypothetical protein [Helicobacter pylori]
MKRQVLSIIEKIQASLLVCFQKSQGDFYSVAKKKRNSANTLEAVQKKAIQKSHSVSPF